MRRTGGPPMAQRVACSSGRPLSMRMYATYLPSALSNHMTFFVSDQSRERLPNIGANEMPSALFIRYTPASDIDVGCTPPMFHWATIFQRASAGAAGLVSMKTVPAAWQLSRQSRDFRELREDYVRNKCGNAWD